MSIQSSWYLDMLDHRVKAKRCITPLITAAEIPSEIPTLRSTSVTQIIHLRTKGAIPHEFLLFKVNFGLGEREFIIERQSSLGRGLVKGLGIHTLMTSSGESADWISGVTSFPIHSYDILERILVTGGPSLSILDITAITATVSLLSPTYSWYHYQCYWYCAIVKATIRQLFQHNGTTNHTTRGDASRHMGSVLGFQLVRSVETRSIKNVEFPSFVEEVGAMAVEMGYTEDLVNRLTQALQAYWASLADTEKVEFWEDEVVHVIAGHHAMLKILGL